MLTQYKMMYRDDNGMPFFSLFLAVIPQALNVFSATLCVKLGPCTSGTYRSTWSHVCLSATSATSSWRPPSSSWSTRSATPSPLEGSSKESKYSTSLPTTSQNPAPTLPQLLPPQAGHSPVLNRVYPGALVVDQAGFTTEFVPDMSKVLRAVLQGNLYVEPCTVEACSRQRSWMCLKHILVHNAN